MLPACSGFLWCYTLPKFKRTPERLPKPKRKVVFQPSFLRGEPLNFGRVALFYCLCLGGDDSALCEKADAAHFDKYISKKKNAFRQAFCAFRWRFTSPEKAAYHLQSGPKTKKTTGKVKRPENSPQTRNAHPKNNPQPDGWLEKINMAAILTDNVDALSARIVGIQKIKDPIHTFSGPVFHYPRFHGNHSARLDAACFCEVIPLWAMVRDTQDWSGAAGGYGYGVVDKCTGLSKDVFFFG